MSWRKHRFVEGWLLEHWKDTKTSYILTVPPSHCLLCQNKLKNIPGGIRKFITIDTSDGTEIYFTTNLSFNECVKWLQSTFGLQVILPKKKERKPKYVGIDQYTLDGQYIKTWHSISQAANELNINPGGIWQTMKGKQKYAGGFVWKKNNN